MNINYEYKLQVFGPPFGKMHIFFIDDFNLPKKDDLNHTQTVLELLRQVIEMKGLYNRKELYFMNFEDI